MTIRLIAVTTQHKVLVERAPKNAFSIGDVIWAKSTLRNEVAQFGRPRGAVVGSDLATLTVVSQTKGNVKLTTTLPGGTLRAAGTIGTERGRQSACSVGRAHLGAHVVRTRPGF
jgi:hypothetical protein